jgi:predicted enzyme related to lactoylglutathione lyase
MFKNTEAFSSFSVDDITKAKEFYGTTLGLEIEESPMGLEIKIAGSNPIFVYPKSNHVPATFTILNFPVDDIDTAVSELEKKGITLERYDMPDMPQDDMGVVRNTSGEDGPKAIAWFTDPAKNVLSIMQMK